MTQLVKGVVKRALVMVLYGMPGVGKSRFASGAPHPVFIGPEDNDQLDCLKFPIVESYNQLINYFDEILSGKHKGENFKTVVLDSISGMEKIIHREICQTAGQSMAHACGGYGKAYSKAEVDLWEIREHLYKLYKAGFNIIIICHAIKTPFTDPILQTAYDVREMSLHKSKTGADCNSFFTEWASAVLFMRWETYKSENEQFAGGSGRREILTDFRPSHLAKNRFNLPYKIPIEEEAMGSPSTNWQTLRNHIIKFYKAGEKAKEPETDFEAICHNAKGKLAMVKSSEKQKAKMIKYYKDIEALHKKDEKKAYHAMGKLIEKLVEIIKSQ